MSTRHVITVVAALLAGIGTMVGFPSGDSFAADATPSDCVWSAEDEQHARRLRESLGLPYTDDLVLASFTLPGYRCAMAGVPLLPEEEVRFIEVLNAQAELSRLVEDLSLAPAFAGAWLEADALIIASTDGNLGVGLRPDLGTITAREAEFTKVELDAVAAEIAHLNEDSDIGYLAGAITYVTVDEPANRVRVGIAADVRAAHQALTDAYGQMVSVYFAEAAEGGFLVCTVSDCGTKGGLAIDHPEDIPCTSGFIAKAKVYGGTTYSHRILTAGHCVAYSGGPATTGQWHNPAGTQTWGKNIAMDFVPYEYPDYCPITNTMCFYNDLGLIHIGSSPPSDWNRYFTAVSPGWVEIDGRQPKSSQLVGQYLLRNGRTSGLDTGTITAKPAYATLTGADCGYAYLTCRYYDVVEVELDSHHGDSGSGFYRFYYQPSGVPNYDAFGILSSGKAGYTYYYAWDQPFFADWGMTDRRTVYPCITADCPLS